MNVPPPSSQPQESTSPPEAQVDGKADISEQPQNLVSQEVKEQNKSGDASVSQQPQAPASQVEAKVDEGKTDSTQPSPPSQAPVSQLAIKWPYDIPAWIFWILFLLAIVAVPIWMAQKSVPDQQVSLPYLSRNISAYTVITSNDIEMKSVDHSVVMNGTVRNANDLIGHYTLVNIRSDQPIYQNQIGPKPDLSLILDTLAVAIPANRVTILGSNLLAGNEVSVAALPLSSPDALPIKVFDRVLVLDVKVVGSQTFFVLAIPAQSWLDFLMKTHNTTVVLALLVE